MSGELKTKFRALAEEIESMGSRIPKNELDDFTQRFNYLVAEMQRAGKTGDSILTMFGKRIVSISASVFAMYFSFYDFVRYGRAVISTIVELDTALTEMRKVSDETIDSLKAYQEQTFDTAATIGTTAAELQDATADWMRLGETLQEAAESSKAATILLNVSEFESIDEATESLVSMSQAYQELTKMDIIDVLNNIGNNYSIATDELATALQASAATLTTQGNDFYEAVALVTAGNAIVQDADKVGAGIRTISLRIAGTEEAEEELEAAGEDISDYIVATASKTQKTIMDYTKTLSNPKGVDVLDDNGNLKSTYEILKEISEVYAEIQAEDKEYGTNRASALVEYLAGEILPECIEICIKEHI